MVAYGFTGGRYGGLGRVGLCVFCGVCVEILFMIFRRNCISSGARPDAYCGGNLLVVVLVLFI